METNILQEKPLQLFQLSFVISEISFQELFKRVIPHQCLGAVWSRRRDKNSRDKEAASVVATVEQVSRGVFK